MAELEHKTAATLLGGAGGSVLISVLMRSGVAPKPAAVTMAVAGGVGGLALRGAARHAALGAAAASLGMLALMWMEARASRPRRGRRRRRVECGRRSSGRGVSSRVTTRSRQSW